MSPFPIVNDVDAQEARASGNAGGVRFASDAARLRGIAGRHVVWIHDSGAIGGRFRSTLTDESNGREPAFLLVDGTLYHLSRIEVMP